MVKRKTVFTDVIESELLSPSYP